MKYNNKSWSVIIKPRTSEEEILKQILKAMKKLAGKLLMRNQGGKMAKILEVYKLLKLKKKTVRTLECLEKASLKC